MNRCDRKQFWRWLLLTVGLLSAAASGAACEAASLALSRMRRDVDLLAQAESKINEPAFERLLQDGAAAVPVLVAALERQDGTYRQKRDIIWCLECMRALEGVPGLVRFSDREDWFLVSDEIASFPITDANWDKPPSPVGRKHLALKAREAIGLIIDRTGKSTWGGVQGYGTNGKPGTEEYYEVLEKEKAYWRKVNSWYQDWRERFDPEQQPGLLEKTRR